MKRLSSLALLSFGLLAGCGSDDPPPPTDAGVDSIDGSVAADAGVRAKCTLPENNPSCRSVTDSELGCLNRGERLNSDNRCGDFCPGYLQRTCGDSFCPRVCATGQCVDLAIIDREEPLNLKLDVGELRPGFFVRMVFYGETSGGNPFTCADVRADPTGFFRDPCFNPTDMRASAPQPGPGNVYTFTFSRVPQDSPVVFVVYGFPSSDTTEPPVGISCTETLIPVAGSGGGSPLEVNATRMERL